MTEITYFNRREIGTESIISLQQSIDLLYLHKYFYGGVTTFTVHLFYNMRLNTNKPILHFSIKNEKKLRDFGYGIKYKNINFDHLLDKKDVLITVLKIIFFM